MDTQTLLLLIVMIPIVAICSTIVIAVDRSTRDN